MEYLALSHVHSRCTTRNTLHNLLSKIYDALLQEAYGCTGPACAQAEGVCKFVQSSTVVTRICRFLEDCSQAHSTVILLWKTSVSVQALLIRHLLFTAHVLWLSMSADASGLLHDNILTSNCLTLAVV